MKKLVIVFILFLCATTNAQNNEKISLHTDYFSVIETICEETPEPNPCAGQEIYLILKFEKTKVSITEKAVSTCGKEYLQNTFEYPWKLAHNNEIKIFSEPNEIKYSSLENLKFILEDQTIYGHKNEGSNTSKKYMFLTRSN